MKQLCGVCKVVGLLVTIGAINWGLVGLFHLNPIDRILGEMSVASRAVYGLVGLAGVMMFVSYFKTCPACSKKV